MRSLQEASSPTEIFQACHCQDVETLVGQRSGSAKEYWAFASPGPSDHLRVKQPLLKLQTMADGICQDEAYTALQRHISMALENDRLFLCYVEGGAHMHRCEGFNGNNDWIGEVALEFFLHCGQ